MNHLHPATPNHAMEPTANRPYAPIFSHVNATRNTRRGLSLSR
jgi:hypothetical protein